MDITTSYGKLALIKKIYFPVYKDTFFDCFFSLFLFFFFFFFPGKTNPNQELRNRVVLRIECDNTVITAFDHRALAKYICNIIRSSPQ